MIDELLNNRSKLVHVEGLCERGLDAEPLSDFGKLRRCRDKQDWDAAEYRACTPFTQQLRPIHIRHVEIKHEDVRRFASSCIECRSAVRGFINHVPLGAQIVRKHVAEFSMVIRDQDVARHGVLLE